MVYILISLLRAREKMAPRIIGETGISGYIPLLWVEKMAPRIGGIVVYPPFVGGK